MVRVKQRKKEKTTTKYNMKFEASPAEQYMRKSTEQQENGQRGFAGLRKR